MDGLCFHTMPSHPSIHPSTLSIRGPTLGQTRAQCAQLLDTGGAGRRCRLGRLRGSAQRHARRAATHHAATQLARQGEARRLLAAPRRPLAASVIPSHPLISSHPLHLANPMRKSLQPHVSRLQPLCCRCRSSPTQRPSRDRQDRRSGSTRCGQCRHMHIRPMSSVHCVYCIALHCVSYTYTHCTTRRLTRRTRQ